MFMIYIMTIFSMNLSNPLGRDAFGDLQLNKIIFVIVFSSRHGQITVSLDKLLM